MRWFNSILMLFVGQVAVAQTATEYLEVKFQKGDALLKLLTRYQIEHHSCNSSEFYRINNLKKNATLLADKTYKLPILKYSYDGTSIRSTLKNQDLRLAKQIEQYNIFLRQTGLTDTDFRKKGNPLYVPYHFFGCPTDVSKVMPTNRTFPIFGKAYQDVPLEDQKLAGAVYYLVAGHGGPDTGARGEFRNEMICEDEYAYDITLRLARNLLSHGALVYMIVRDTSDGIRDGELLECDFGEFCYPNQIIPVGQKDRLTQRTDQINELYQRNRKLGVDYQCVVEVHIDSRGLDQRLDVYFYHYPGNQQGRHLAESLHQTFSEKYAQHRASGDYFGTISERDLHTLRESKPMSVFIELGNIQNPADQKRFVDPNNRQALANWLAQGLIGHY